MGINVQLSGEPVSEKNTINLASIPKNYASLQRLTYEINIPRDTINTPQTTYLNKLLQQETNYSQQPNFAYKNNTTGTAYSFKTTYDSLQSKPTKIYAGNITNTPEFTQTNTYNNNIINYTKG